MSSRDIAIVQDIDRAFGLRRLRELEDGDWNAFVDNRNAGNRPATRERYITSVVSFLNWCRKKPRRWLTTLPEFERDQDARKPKHRRARRVAELTPEIIMLMVDNAAEHFAAQIAVEWSTGGRVSSILYGCRICDVILAEGREQITFQDTKNGEPVVAALHPWAAQKLREYLKWRGRLQDREAPLFLTQLHKPYSVKSRGVHGHQNRSAFRGMKRRAIVAMRKLAAAEALRLWRLGRREAAWDVIASARSRASLIAQVTQHWFRHLLATRLAGNVRLAMEQGGWLRPESITAYTHDVPEIRWQTIRALPIGPADTAAASQLKLQFTTGLAGGRSRAKGGKT